jgi:glucose uptake protein GlcU
MGVIIYFAIAVVIAVALTIYFANSNKHEADDTLLALIVGLLWGVEVVAGIVILCYFVLLAPFRLIGAIINR